MIFMIVINVSCLRFQLWSFRSNVMNLVNKPSCNFCNFLKRLILINLCWLLYLYSLRIIVRDSSCPSLGYFSLLVISFNIWEIKSWRKVKRSVKSFYRWNWSLSILLIRDENLPLRLIKPKVFIVILLNDLICTTKSCFFSMIVLSLFCRAWFHWPSLRLIISWQVIKWHIFFHNTYSLMMVFSCILIFKLFLI